MLLNLFRRKTSDPGLAAAGGVPRSPRWPSVRAAHLKAHPACEACGGRDSLEVHHIQPFHLKPELELHPRNLLTLCGDPCHLVHGHCMAWTRCCPTVVADVAAYRARVEAAKAAASARKAG